MTKETMEIILEILKLNPNYKVVDMTVAHQRWIQILDFVEEISTRHSNVCKI
jgi:hypothetical protein